MTRKTTRTIVSIGLIYAAFGAGGFACGGGDSTVGGQATDGAATGDATRRDAAADTAHDSTGATNNDATMDAPTTPDTSGDSAATSSDSGDDSSATDGGDDGADVSSGSADASDGESDSADAAAPGSDGAADAASDSPSDSADAGDATSDATDSASDAAACDFNGTWGTEITINVSWMPSGIQSIILSPGSGVIRQWALSTRVQSGLTLTDTAVVCGIELPDFMGTMISGGETYGIHFPNSLFDNSYLPSFTINGTLTGPGPGSSYSSTASAALLGLTLANPTTATWPGTIPTNNQLDQDMDGHPGVTANVAQGNGYSNVPLDIFKTQRTDTLYLAIRQVTQVSAVIVDCDHSSGSVSIPQLPSGSGNYAIDSHVLGCEIAGSDAGCSAGQAAFVDANDPIFSPTTTSFASARMATGATCAMVRAQFP